MVHLHFIVPVSTIFMSSISGTTQLKAVTALFLYNLIKHLIYGRMHHLKYLRDSFLVLMIAAKLFALQKKTFRPTYG